MHPHTYQPEHDAQHLRPYTEPAAPWYGEEYPLSRGQQALWFLCQLNPDSAAYNVVRAVRLHSVDLDRFVGAWQQLTDRHPALRTTFAVTNGKPVQRVHPAWRLHVERVDAAGLSDCEVQALVDEAARRPFDLERGPLFRLHLIVRSPEICVVVLAMHHIITDGWSIAVLLQGLGELYACTGSPLRESPITFGQYVAWQEEMLVGPEAAADLAHWTEQLSGELPVLQLPTDRPRPPVPSGRGGLRSFTVGPEVTRQLKAISKQHRATLFTTLLAAYQVLLHRYTGQDDIIVGAPTTGRTRPEFARLAGYFVNPIALRSNVGGNPAFAAFLDQVRATLSGALDHQAYPFPLLVERLQPERDASRSPIFQTMFVFQKAHTDPGLNALILGQPGVPVDLGGMAMDAVPYDQGAAQFDLTLGMSEMAGGLAGTLEYNADLFDAATIDRLAVHFQTLLAAIAADPDQPVDSLPLLSDAERHQLLVAWNETASVYPRDRCFHDLLEDVARRTPAAEAVTCEGETLTFGALNRRANQLARFLRRQGVGPERLVAVSVERRPDLVVALLAVLKAGGAYVPVDPAYPAERKQLMLEDAQPAAVITAAQLEAWAGAVAAESDDDLPPLATPDNMAYVIYTSGSTGRPKGAMIAHRGLVNYATWAADAYGVTDGGGAPVHSSVSFDLTVTSLWVPLLAGRRVVLVPEAHGIEGLSAVLREPGGFSLVKITPAHLALLNQQLTPGEAAGAARALVIGGEALTPEAIAFWREHAPGTALINEYGPTETVVGCCIYEVPPGQPLAGAVPIGRPIANTQLYILDRQLQPVPVGVPGELYIGGDGVGLGYLNRPELTAERFIPDPFRPDGRLYKTGDLCRHLPDGNIDFLGRIDHQVKIRGYRIELGEIESAVAACAGVRDSLVLVREDVPGARRLVAYVTPASANPDAVRASLRERLPEYMVPAAVVALDAFPVTPNGKVDRKALPAPEAAGGDAAAGAYVAPRNAAEEALAAIWADLLGVSRISVHDNFFALGGDSILAIQVIARVRQAGLTLSPNQLMQHQTVAELAAAAGVSTPVAAPADQSPVAGDVPLTPIQRWFWEQQLPQPQHWNQALLLEPLQPLDPKALEAALQHLLVHHDALRMRFTQTATGDWAQTNAAPEPPAEPLLWVLPWQSLEEAVYGVQASLDLQQGPLLRAALIDLGAGRGQRLVVAIHHLVVDGVSWRILLDDLHTAYRQIASGQAPHLPQKTTSYQTWARGLAAAAACTDDPWASQDWSAAGPLPLDHPDGENLEAMAAEVAVSLDPAATRTLLGHGSEAEAVLLAALARALGAWTGGAATAVDLEGHGRAEALVGGADLSRTVGWFTSIYPVLLQTRSDAAPAEALAAVRSQLARIPHRGAGFGISRYLAGDSAPAALPRRQVSFNYLGQLDQALAGSDLLRRAGEPCGAMHSPLGRRTHELEVLGAVTGGLLQVTFTYGGAQLERRTVERLAEAFLAYLRDLLGVARAAADPSLAVLIRSGGSGTAPLFLVHSADLLGNRFAHLGHVWHSPQPLYGLYPARLLEQLGAGATLEAIAARFVGAIRAVQPAGPYHLGGYSYGSLVAYEVARQLRAAGEHVERLTVIDDGPGALPGDQAMLQAGAAPAGHETMQAFLALMRPAIEARRAYRPEPSDLFVQVVRAEKATPGVWRPAAYDLGWRELALGGVTVHTLPGDHFSLLQPPFVTALAGLLAGMPDLLAAGDD